MIAILLDILLERLRLPTPQQLRACERDVAEQRSMVRIKNEEIDELRERVKLAESQARQAESQLFNANSKLDKQLSILTDVRCQLSAEQHARKQAEKALSEQLSRVQAAIDTLQGRA